MKFLKIQLPSSFLHLTTGHVISQVIGAVGSILVAKIYGANLLGVFSVYYTLAMILSSFNTGRLESILFLEQHKVKRLNNVSGLILIILVTSSLLFVASYLISSKVINEYFVSRDVLCLAILTAMIKSIYTLFQSMILFSENYKKLKKAKIGFTIVRYSFQFLFFFIYIHFLGLILGYLIASAFVLIYYYYGNEIVIKRLNVLMFKKSIKEHVEILKYAIPGDAINTITVNVFPILLLSMYGEKITGNYFMAFLILSIPLTFLQSVISPVFFQKSVELYGKEHYSQLLKYTSSIVKRTFFLISLPLLILLLFGEEIVVFLFEDDWRATGKFVQIFAFMYGLRVLYSPISSLEETLKKNNISLIINIYFMLVLFACLYVGKNYYNIFEIAIMISVFMSLGYVFLLVYFYRLLKAKIY